MPRHRVVFMGTPDIAAEVLESLINDSRIDVVAVVAQPDRPKGRSMKLAAPPTKDVARNHGIPVWQPKQSSDPEFLNAIRTLKPEALVVIAYGQILRPDLLDIPNRGALNIHTSLLPKYRGAAPIQWALYHGESTTGVTLMQMDAGMDTGPIIASRSTPISDQDTGQSLHDRLAGLASDLLRDHLVAYLLGAISPRPQAHNQATMAPKLTKQAGVIDWNRSAEAIDRQVRAFTPWPGSHTELRDAGKAPLSLKILEGIPLEGDTPPGASTVAGRRLLVGCGLGDYEVKRVQPAGRPAMSAEAFLAGHPLSADAHWGTQPTDSS